MLLLQWIGILTVVDGVVAGLMSCVLLTVCSAQLVCRSGFLSLFIVRVVIVYARRPSQSTCRRLRRRWRCTAISLPARNCHVNVFASRTTSTLSHSRSFTAL